MGPVPRTKESGIEQLLDALRAYRSGCECPGIEIEPGLTSGCTGGDDCPTHTALARYEEGPE
jgi:hypothetical protein